MLNVREVQDVIDDVLGNKKDSLRLAKDFLNQPAEHLNRILKLEKRLEAMRQEIECGDCIRISAESVLERIEETERLVQAANKLYGSIANDVFSAIKQLTDKNQEAILLLRYIDCVSDWNEIAERTGKPKNEVKRIHAVALSEMKLILKKIEAEKNAA